MDQGNCHRRNEARYEWIDLAGIWASCIKNGRFRDKQVPRFKSQSEHRRSYGATDGVDREADPADGALSPHRIEPATVLVDIKAWPGNVSVLARSERRPALTSTARVGV